VPASILLAVALASAPATAPAAVPPPVESSAAIPALVLDAVSIDPQLFEEMKLRLAGRTLIASDALVDVPTTRFAWVGVEWTDTGEARLRIVVSDGRAYSRLVTAPSTQLPRTLAGALSNMIDAIEEDSIAPEAVDVAVPLPVPAPAPVAPTPVTLPPASKPAPPASPPPPDWELGPVIGGTAIFGVGPPTDLDGFVGAGGSIGLDAVHRSGGLASVAVRVLTHDRSDLRLVRVRAAIAGGYALRRRSFELLARVGASVEPVVLRDDGRPSVKNAPLVGAFAMVSPAYVLRSKRRPMALRIALDVELAASMEASSSPGVIRWIDATPDDPISLLRAGGVEIGLGASIGGWFALPNRRRQRNG
jgi:hypothetical protein